MAFKVEGLEQLHRKAPYPINKVTVLDGEAKNKIALRNYLLEGVAGVNQYFLIEINKEIDKKIGVEKTVRKYSTPNFIECINRLAKGLQIHDENSNTNYIVLSPSDLVYVHEEGEGFNHINWDDKKKIADRTYIMRSSDKSNCYFLPAYVASLISPYDAKTKKGEFESTNKSEKTKDGNQIIKENFLKLKIDRLGNIKPI